MTPSGRAGAASALTPRHLVVAVPAVVSLVVLALAGLSTYADPGRRWVGLASAGEADALPAWWATVLYVLVALACWARAEALRRSVDGLRSAAAGVPAWALLGSLLSVLSADHVLGLHRLLAGDPRLTALPGPVAAHPVQAVLVAVGAPVVVVLLVLVGRRQRLLLLLGGCLYVVSGVLIDQRLLQLSWNHVRLETLELSLEWAGALALMAAAVSEGRTSAGRGGRRQERRPGSVPPGTSLPEVVDVGDRLRQCGG